MKQGISVAEMKTELDNLRWLKTTTKYTLGRGTPITAPRVRVWSIDWAECYGHIRLLPPKDQTMIEEAA